MQPHISNTQKIIILVIFIALVIYGLSFISLGVSVNDRLNDIDGNQIVLVEHLAAIEYSHSYKSFTKVFDAKSRKFVEEKIAKKQVEPYGMSKEHRGQYILVDVDSEGRILSKWINP